MMVNLTLTAPGGKGSLGWLRRRGAAVAVFHAQPITATTLAVMDQDGRSLFRPTGHR